MSEVLYKDPPNAQAVTTQTPNAQAVTTQTTAILHTAVLLDQDPHMLGAVPACNKRMALVPCLIFKDLQGIWPIKLVHFLVQCCPTFCVRLYHAATWLGVV